MRAFFQLPNASVSGARDVPPSAFIFAKAGDSASCSRIHSEMARRNTETRNGMRQPQAAKVASPVIPRVTRITRSDINRPAVAVVWIQDV